MTERKPSHSEEEYFLKLDAERIAKRKQEAQARRTADERRSHHMRCPKCGGHLVEQRYHGVQVDRCPDCKGVWFDAGEAESLLEREAGAITRFFGDMLSGLGGSGRGKKRR